MIAVEPIFHRRVASHTRLWICKKTMIHHLISAAGFLAFAAIAWLFSADRRKVQWRTIVWGMGLQLAIGLLIFRLPGSHRIFLWLNDAVVALLNVSKSGSSFLFGPLAAGPGEQGSIGFIRADIAEAAWLMGERVILTEVVSYQDLAQMASSGQLADPRSVVILSYALCGFAHVASVAIFIGGTAALAPSRRDDLAGLGLRALLAATLATLMTGCVAGIFSGGQGVLMAR